jgi:ankyrin repeat protein
MKHILLTIVAAVLVVGCATTQSLHHAVQFGNTEAINQHLAAGGDVNAKDKWENTPLHAAAWKGHKEVAELFIAKGADVNAKNPALTYSTT